jgi:transposase
MPRPYSQDLRDRVVASVGGGCSRRTTAKLFSVSIAAVVRWSQRFATLGSAAALAMGGHRPHRLAGRRDWLLARTAEKPDLTLREILAELAADGVKVSHDALWAFFTREGITFKKSLHASERHRADIAHRRERWRKYQGRLFRDPRLARSDHRHRDTAQFCLRRRRQLTKIPFDCHTGHIVWQPENATCLPFGLVRPLYT